MRLLYRDANKKPRLKDFDRNEVPPYAILSHTWSKDEVIYQDIISNGNHGKVGYAKIDFSLKQAEKDGLQYCWIDTCCINKENLVELSEAINSMFRWYRNADKCYVYLSDVPQESFQSSRWFTRGWTLQELLAPSTVKFFSSDGICLGDKRSLITEIHERTQIPVTALQGQSLADFSVEVKLSWIAWRQTKLEEDMAYSLLGIFGISMPLIYGEGRENAEFRLRKHIEERSISAGKAFVSTVSGEFTLPFALPGAPLIASFTGRAAEISSIAQALPLGAARETVVLYGMGGIGKTQIAIEFAKDRRDIYTAVLWMDGTDEASLGQSFADTARRLSRAYPSSLPLKLASEANDISDTINAVRDWLDIQSNNRWLLVIDNVDDPHIPGVVEGLYDVRQYLPVTLHGHVLITTRSSQLRIGRQIWVQKILDKQECLKILRDNSRRPDIEHDSSALELIKRLDGLPLAIASAGAYLSQDPDSVADYLEQYQTSWLALQQSSPSLPEHEGRRLEITWEISRQRVRQKNINACRLLELWAFFANDDLWYELLQAGRDGSPEWFSDITRSKIIFKNLMRILCDYGLVEAQQQTAGYGLHTCIHDWICEVIDTSDPERTILALKCVSLLVPDKNKPKYWITQRRLLGHANYLSKRVRGYEQYQSYQMYFYSLGALYLDQGKLTEAETMYQLALEGCKKTLGPEHTSTLDAVYKLGVTYYKQDKLVEAEAMYQRALEGYMKPLRPKHTLKLGTFYKLGVLYYKQDKPTEADTMYQRASEGYEKALKLKHTSTLDTVYSLGVLYYRRDKLVEAEAMYQRALESKEKTLGPEHTSTLDTVHNLGILYDKQGKLAEAEAMYQRALEGYEKTLGPEHTSTLGTVHSLGVTYYKQGKLVEAEAIFQRALKGREKTLGPEHTSTLGTVHNLGDIYYIQDKLVEAEAMYQRALEGYEKALGPEHTSTLGTAHNLGVLYDEQDKLVEAEAMYQRALEGYEKALGPEHTSTLDTLHNLGILYDKQDKLIEVEAMYQRASKGKEKTLKPEQTSTLDTVHNLRVLSLQ